MMKFEGFRSPKFPKVAPGAESHTAPAASYHSSSACLSATRSCFLSWPPFRLQLTSDTRRCIRRALRYNSDTLLELSSLSLQTIGRLPCKWRQQRVFARWRPTAS